MGNSVERREGLSTEDSGRGTFLSLIRGGAGAGGWHIRGTQGPKDELRSGGVPLADLV